MGGTAWTPLGEAEADAAWDVLYRWYAFRPSMDAAEWPAIVEPPGSVTFRLADENDDEARWAAAFDAIDAEALRAFVWALPGETLRVLDWQHESYRLDPAAQALDEHRQWPVTVWPNGDYYVFATDDWSEATFGHPWERTLCVWGPRLTGSLARSLESWLPVVRRGGRPVSGG